MSSATIDMSDFSPLNTKTSGTLFSTNGVEVSIFSVMCPRRSLFKLATKDWLSPTSSISPRELWVSTISIFFSFLVPTFSSDVPLEFSSFNFVFFGVKSLIRFSASTVLISILLVGTKLISGFLFHFPTLGAKEFIFSSFSWASTSLIFSFLSLLPHIFLTKSLMASYTWSGLHLFISFPGASLSSSSQFSVSISECFLFSPLLFKFNDLSAIPKNPKTQLMPDFSITKEQKAANTYLAMLTTHPTKPTDDLMLTHILGRWLLTFDLTIPQFSSFLPLAKSLFKSLASSYSSFSLIVSTWFSSIDSSTSIILNYHKMCLFEEVNQANISL